MPLIAEPELEAAEPMPLAAEPPSIATSAQPHGETDEDSRPLLPPKPKSARYDSLDMWRGAACLMLVFYHCTFYAAGGWRPLDPTTWSLEALALNLMTRLWVGVPLFFVVSGYCIAASVDSLRRKPHSLTNYFARRFRRIYPPLWAAFAAAIVLLAGLSLWPELYARCVQLPPLSALSVQAWLGNFTASESWLSTLSGGEPNYLLKNTWTLCYEEQFYLVTGVLLLISALRFFETAAVVTAMVFVGRHVLTALDIPVAGFFFDGHWLMFAMGLLVYQHINYYDDRARWGTWALLGGGFVYGLAMRVLCEHHDERHLGEYIAMASAFSALLIYLKPWDQQIANHTLAQPFNWCGTISYSIYLTHFPIVVFLASLMAAWGFSSDGMVVLVVTPLCLAITLVVGWLFYMFVERHFVNQPSVTN